MSIIKFPGNEESYHPQYLWNNFEYVIRMLTQNKIGISINEPASGNHVIISASSSNSMNNVAFGPVEIIPETQRDLSTSTTQWIYCRLTSKIFQLENVRPAWNSILHGWYHPKTSDRAVCFIDASLPQGQRVIAMDSFNSMFDYDTFVPDSPAGVLVYEAPADASLGKPITKTLPAGKYRFEVKGGTGGKGGNCPGGAYWYSVNGGAGGIAPSHVLKFRLQDNFTFIIQRGVDGEDGQPAVGGIFNETAGSVVTHTLYSRSAGGGASGQDSYVQFTDGIDLIRSIGGAGGGGAYAVTNQDYSGTNIIGTILHIYRAWFEGPGGGGAGSDSENTAQDGGTGPVNNTTNIFPVSDLYIGKKGEASIGGRGGRSYPWGTGPNNGSNDGFSGQDYLAGDRRNGGDSAGIPLSMNYNRPQGGATGKSTSSGHVEIWRTD
jgi:hypothetical protein